MGKKIEEIIEQLEREVKELKKQLFCKIRKGVGIGDTFKLAGLEWKVLDITKKGYECLSMDKYGEERQFDSSYNDWKSSDLREELNTEFYKQLAYEIGAENIIEFERDLLSLDGQTEYGKCMDKISLITVDEYRKYRSIIPNTDDSWWWTVTPDSTKCNDDSEYVRGVSPRGGIRNSSYSSSRGVRPFCIFSSAIFESEE